MYGDVHSIANILDPCFLGDSIGHSKQVECEDIMFMYGTSGTEDNDIAMYTQYQEFCIGALEEKKENTFRYKMLITRTSTVSQYWKVNGGRWPKLQDLALRLFSMATLLADSE